MAFLWVQSVRRSKGKESSRPSKSVLGDFPHRMPIEILIRRERAEIEQVGELQGELFGKFHGRLVFCSGLAAGGALLGPTVT